MKVQVFNEKHLQKNKMRMKHPNLKWTVRLRKIAPEIAKEIKVKKALCRQ